MAGKWILPNFKKIFWDQTLDLSDGGWKVIFLKSTYVVNQTTHEFVTNIVASECDCTGYTGGFAGAGRKAITLDVNENTGAIRLDIGFADISMGNLGNGTNNTIGSVAVWRPVTDDTDSPVAFVFDPGDVTTNGSPVTFDGTAAASGGNVQIAL